MSFNMSSNAFTFSIKGGKKKLGKQKEREREPFKFEVS